MIKQLLSQDCLCKHANSASTMALARKRPNLHYVKMFKLQMQQHELNEFTNHPPPLPCPQMQPTLLQLLPFAQQAAAMLQQSIDEQQQRHLCACVSPLHVSWKGGSRQQQAHRLLHFTQPAAQVWQHDWRALRPHTCMCNGGMKSTICSASKKTKGDCLFYSVSYIGHSIQSECQGLFW